MCVCVCERVSVCLRAQPWLACTFSLPSSALLCAAQESEMSIPLLHLLILRFSPSHFSPPFISGTETDAALCGGCGRGRGLEGDTGREMRHLPLHAIAKGGKIFTLTGGRYLHLCVLYKTTTPEQHSIYAMWEVQDSRVKTQHGKQIDAQ